MSISADFLITPQSVASAVPPPSRPAVAPAGERENAQNRGREPSKNQNGPLSFRAALDASTVGGIAKAASEAIAGPDDRALPPRESRVPAAGPIELAGNAASELFARASSGPGRSADPVFAAAVSRYSASYFAGSSFFARPGETLEVTA
jgi:hypothetical protein